MKKLLFILTIFIALTGFRRDTANRIITGTVYSADDKLPFHGFGVIVKVTSIGTQNNASGKYSLSVPEGSTTLVFSFIGFQLQTVAIGTKTKVDVYLKGSSNQLNEIVASAGVLKAQRYSQQDVTKRYKSSGIIPGAGVRTVLRGNRTADSKIYGYYAPAPMQNDESYKGTTENTFTNVTSTPLSTFSVDVDAASYSNIRRFINSGQLPPADAVRVEEMINYFSYDLAGPADGGPVAIHTELSSAHGTLNIACCASA